MPISSPIAVTQTQNLYKIAAAAANSVAVYANGGLILTQSGLNFNNTATINVFVQANTTRSNIQLNANTASIGNTFSIVSVLDLGADPTGANDSIVAFNAAWSKIKQTGGRIVIPPGTYLLNSTWTCDVSDLSGYNYEISGYGAKLKSNASSGITEYHMVLDGDQSGPSGFNYFNITVEGLHFDHINNGIITGAIKVASTNMTKLKNIVVEASGDTVASKAGYAAIEIGTVTGQESNPDAPSKWTHIDSFFMRKQSGTFIGTPEVGILIKGQANACRIENCALGDLQSAIRFVNYSGLNAFANGVRIINNDFEGVNVCIDIRPTSNTVVMPDGLQIAFNRVEAANTFFKFNTSQRHTDSSINPPVFIDNYIIGDRYPAVAGQYTTYIDNPYDQLYYSITRDASNGTSISANTNPPNGYALKVRQAAQIEGNLIAGNITSKNVASASGIETDLLWLKNDGTGSGTATSIRFGDTRGTFYGWKTTHYQNMSLYSGDLTIRKGDGAKYSNLIMIRDNSTESANSLNVLTGLLNVASYNSTFTGNVFVSGNVSSSSNLSVSGSVGIGTSSPGSKLEVDGGNISIRSGNHLRLHRTDNGNYCTLDFTNNYFRLNTGGDLVFDTSGRLGIGTTSPAARLDVNGTIAISGTQYFSVSGNYLRIQEPSGNVVMFLGNNNDRANYYDNEAHYFRARNGASNYMRIDGNGQVGIAGVPPAASTTSKLHLSSDLTLTGSNKSILGNLYYDTGWKYASNGYGWGLREDNAGKVQFVNAGNNTGGAGAAASVSLSNMMTFDIPNQRIGIGTASPSVTLDVNGPVYARYNVTFGIGGFLAPGGYAQLGKDSTARMDILNAGGLDSGSPFWNGYHFTTSDTITNSSSQNSYPRAAFYFNYSTVTNPSNMAFNMYIGNNNGIPVGMNIGTETAGAVNLITSGLTRFTVGATGIVSASVDMRAPIFYDIDNTSYYVDPATSTTSASLAGKVVSRNTLGTINSGASKTLAVGELYMVTSATQTITLPPSPAAGDVVGISVGNFTDTTVARNGQNIMGLAENMTIDVAYLGIKLFFVDATYGWRIV